MNRKHQKTLERLFEKPTRTDVTYREVHALLLSLGFECVTGKGSSRMFVHSGGVRFTLHEPHPQKEIKRYAVLGIRQALIEAGVSP